MARKRIYYYLNLHLFSAIRTLVFILFCLNVILFVFGFWHYAAVLIPFIIFSGYLVSRMGIIRISDSGQQKTIKIEDLFQTIYLKSPIAFGSWWQYSINEGTNIYGSITSGRMRAASNDYRVILHLKDSSGNNVYLKERIELDSRFPNEVEYDTKNIPAESRIIKVQRVDKVYHWIKANLSDTELVPIDNISPD